MFFRVTSERLLKAGFQLEKFEDGTFWVMEREAGEEADRLLRICGKALVNFDAEAVEELILLQCGSDLSDPQLYIDGFLWDLTKRDLADIVFLLARGGQPKPPPARERPEPGIDKLLDRCYSIVCSRKAGRSARRPAGPCAAKKCGGIIP